MSNNNYQRPPLRPNQPFNYHQGIPRVIVPRVPRLYQGPTIPYVPHQRPIIPRLPNQVLIDNQIQQRLNQQFNIPNPAPRRPPAIPKKPKSLLKKLKKK